MNERVFLSPPHQTGKELELIKQVLESNYVAPIGPMITAFEEAFCRYTGFAHAAAVSSGTAALHLALNVLGIGKGDAVWASDLTFIGGVAPIVQQQASLVLIDSEAQFYTIDPALVAQALVDAKKRNALPKAIVVTDIYGQCVDYKAIRKLCDEYDVFLIADCAESLGSRYGVEHSGLDADIAIFSFNGNKIITSSGGGMLASDNKEWVERARYFSTQARQPSVHYEHTELGFNYRMSNVVAAIGVAQLEAIDARVDARRAVREDYIKELRKIPYISFMGERPDTRMNAWLSVIMLDAKAPVTPEQIRVALEKHNIESRPTWKPMHQQPVFKNVPYIGGHVSANIFTHGLCLPSGSAMTRQTQDRIISIIHDTCPA